MAGLKELVVLAFLGSVGMTLVILSCASPTFGAVWWPFFVVIFYFLSPIPVLIANRYMENTNVYSSAAKDVALFFTAIIVISAYGLPIVLARAPPENPTIVPGACVLVLLGNTVVFLTILGFFFSFTNDESNRML
ncbi:leptin receptor overlapping transcript-like 1 isoform X1 [Dermatophagoides pteronyssinus]|uniref:leptin receptor overlapping transcript-like 1 isoform X1 n=1 Tax=Dermatophagoides pteronyssinus TaxID=6956 RepID=UPI003F661D98